MNLSFSARFKRSMGAVRRFCSIPHVSDVMGIDLGCTHSRVAIMEGEVPRMIEIDGMRAMPSVVAFHCQEDPFVGVMAKQYSVAYPANTSFNVKNLIGRRFDDQQTKKLMTMVPYKIVKGSDEEVWMQVGSEHKSPTDWYTLILGKIKESVENHLMRMVSKAIIAVPHHFDDRQKELTKEAGQSAGLDVLEIIDEPIAAAFACCKNTDDGITAICDLGGGSFDISLLQIKNRDFKVIGHSHSNCLSGEDFDRALVDYLVKDIRTTHSVDVSGDAKAMMRLKEAAEVAKVELSYAPHMEIYVPFIAGTTSSAIHVKKMLKRSEFEELVQGLIERTRDLCLKCVEESGIIGKVDEVLLVGGMARVPSLQQMIEKVFGVVPSLGEVPDEAVAIGAAIRGRLRIEEETDLRPNQVPLSIGFETYGGFFVRSIIRGTLLPAKSTQTCTTVAENQGKVCLRIFQGEHVLAKFNKWLADLEINGIPPARLGGARIVVTFDVDAEGNLSVSAKLMDRSDIEPTVRDICSIRTSKEYAKNAVKEAMLNRFGDQSKVVLANTKIMAELVIKRILNIIEKSKKKGIEEETIYNTIMVVEKLRDAMRCENELTLRKVIYDAQLQGALLAWDRRAPTNSEELLSEADD